MAVVDSGTRLQEARAERGSEVRLMSAYKSREIEMLQTLQDSKVFGQTVAVDAFLSAELAHVQPQQRPATSRQWKDSAPLRTSHEEAPVLYLNVVMRRASGTLEDWVLGSLPSFTGLPGAEESRATRHSVGRALILQLLHAVHDLHSLGIAHRDLKPPNILLERRMQESAGAAALPNPVPFMLQLADFGSAKHVDGTSNHTCFITTRWYRAPEILLGSTSYSTAVDLWALASIIVQVFLGAPLFCAMRDDGQQLLQHLALLGMPSEVETAAMGISGSGHATLSALRAACPPALASPLPQQTVLDVLAGLGVPRCVAALSCSMLRWDPAQRATAGQALLELDWLYGSGTLDEEPAQFLTAPAHTGPSPPQASPAPSTSTCCMGRQ